MKFQDMPYKRPDFDKVYQEGKALLKQMEEAQSPQQFFDAADLMDKLSSTLATQYSLCHVRHAINTKDPFYEEENNIFDEEIPRFQEFGAEMARISLESKFREDIEKKYGKHLLEKYDVQRKVFKPEIIPDLVEENKLSTEYDKLIASAQIEFDGGTYNLSGMTPFTQSTDRDVRRRANDASWGWLAQRQDTLDKLYDDLVKVRHSIARKLGYDNFIPVAYARMGRTDWNQQDAKKYRQQILESVVPLAQKIYQEQAQRLGIQDMKNFDYNLEFLSGNPKPQGEEAYLVGEATKMYHELSKETGAFFDVMTGQQLMDLTTKPGKRGGGFMTSFPDFILILILTLFFL